MRKTSYLFFARKCFLLICIFVAGFGGVYAQTIKEVKGTVIDVNSVPIIGATVAIKGTTTGTMTDVDGKFSVNVRPTDSISVSFIGYEPKSILVGDKTNITVILEEAANVLDDVVVTAWGVEKKTTVVGSVSTVKPKELKGPTSNITTMLAGRVAGLISYQLSGEPGKDNAEFFVRGVSTFEGSGKSSAPLILINGIESSATELARVQPDDIEAFSVLKDATATSMYGTRGANGVLLITTKGGQVGKTKFNVRYEASMSSNAKDFNLADNVTYMELANEATLTRNPNGVRPYDPRKIDRTRDGADPLIYPNNNWKDIMIKDNTLNHRVNANVSGGVERAKYYLSMSYKVDNGVLKTHDLNDFNTNVKSQTIEIRSNIDLKLTSTTDASFRVSGLIMDQNGPSMGSGSDVFKSILQANPVMFPAVYPSSFIPWAKHPLYGNNVKVQGGSGPGYYNPYANALSGYSEESSTALTIQFELNQDFSFITPGLRGRMMAYTKRNTTTGMSRSVSPYYYYAIMDPEKKDVIEGLGSLNEGREYLSYAASGREVWNENWLEASGVYDKTINEVHALTGTVMAYVREKKLSNADALERSLPQRNVSLSGRVTYGFDNRYLAEFNFGYNASERFDKNNRWGFFPSFGLAWNLAEEKFMEPTRSVLDKLKIRVSYGIVGNDNLTDWINQGGDRYFYLNMMSIPDGNSVFFGEERGKGYKFIRPSRYGNADITWEKSYKSNIALELGLFNALNIEFDMFHDKRTNILLERTNLPINLGLWKGGGSNVTAWANIGEMKSKGFETTVDYNKTINKDAWLSLRGTFSYATNETTVYEEPDYPDNLKYLSRIGYNWNTLTGLIAERLFIDEEDVANSPKQYGEYMAGDIKYRDVNGDGVIDDNDRVKMGYPSTPEVVYGFGFSFGYKDFDVSAFFQGQARTSFMIDAGSISPFYDHNNGRVNGLLEVIADNHWSESNRDPYAFYPRLSINAVSNNNRNSSWWLRDGSFIRLKTVQIGYEPRGSWVKKTGLGGFRIYLEGMNLLTFSKFKMWDVEMKGNGLGYPLQRVFNAGVQLSF